jgi:hypothetical protein
MASTRRESQRKSHAFGRFRSLIRDEMSYKVQENARRIRPNLWDVSKKNFFGRCRVLAAADGADCDALFLGLLQAWWKWWSGVPC